MTADMQRGSVHVGGAVHRAQNGIIPPPSLLPLSQNSPRQKGEPVDELNSVITYQLSVVTDALIQETVRTSLFSSWCTATVRVILHSRSSHSAALYRGRRPHDRYWIGDILEKPSNHENRERAALPCSQNGKRERKKAIYVSARSAVKRRGTFFSGSHYDLFGVYKRYFFRNQDIVKFSANFPDNCA